MAACPRCGRENADDARFCSSCGARLTTSLPAQEQRKVVTVLFCDLVGSTALGESTDPEVMRALLARTFDDLRAILERHGGTVEKFVGDAVMAVFGIPIAHEDDALRAVRAAEEMRAAVAEHGLEARVGVDTGEVVVGGESQTLVTGDAVNVRQMFRGEPAGTGPASPTRAYPETAGRTATKCIREVIHSVGSAPRMSPGNVTDGLNGPGGTCPRARVGGIRGGSRSEVHRPGSGMPCGNSPDCAG